MFIMPYLSLFIRFLYQYNSGTQKLVKIPFIGSMILNVLQLKKQKFSRIDKQRVQIMSGGNFRKAISAGRAFIRNQRVVS